MERIFEISSEFLSFAEGSLVEDFILREGSILSALSVTYAKEILPQIFQTEA